MTRGAPPKCIHCGSRRSTPKGFRRTKYQGVRQRRLCRDCGKRFTPRSQKGLSEIEYLQARHATTQR